MRVKTLRDLRGLRVSLGAPGSSTAHITLRMLQDLGIAQGQIHAERIPNAEIVSRLSNGDIDAAFSGFSVPGATVIAAMNRGARLMPIDGPEIEEMRTRYPYLKRTLIPRARTRTSRNPSERSASTHCSCAAPSSMKISCIACWMRISPHVRR